VSRSEASIKKELRKELEKFSTSKKSFKEYVTSMKELNDWLKEREK